jgi:hypothetical protein
VERTPLRGDADRGDAHTAHTVAADMRPQGVKYDSPPTYQREEPPARRIRPQPCRGADTGRIASPSHPQGHEPNARVQGHRTTSAYGRFTYRLTDTSDANANARRWKDMGLTGA